MTAHNHATRDVKAPGQCPGCDRHRMADDEETLRFRRAQELLAAFAAEMSVETVEPGGISDYAIVLDTNKGTWLYFSGTSRQEAATLMMFAVKLLMTERGKSGRPDGRIPGMSQDN